MSVAPNSVVNQAVADYVTNSGDTPSPTVIQDLLDGGQNVATDAVAVVENVVDNVDAGAAAVAGGTGAAISSGLNTVTGSIKSVLIPVAIIVVVFAAWYLYNQARATE